LDRGIDLFNHRRFFEAHDVWEDAWRVSAGDRALLLQGLIQVAAGFVKWQRRQASGMVALLDKGVEKLSRLEGRFEGVGVSEFLGAIAAWRSSPARIPESSPDPRIPGVLPRIIRRH
jgi:hypothetical protein